MWVLHVQSATDSACARTLFGILFRLRSDPPVQLRKSTIQLGGHLNGGMIVVHHLSSSRSQRIIWLLEELGVQYEVKRYERMSNMLAPPELKRVHPLGKSPVITDGDVTVAESGGYCGFALVPEYHVDTCES